MKRKILYFDIDGVLLSYDDEQRELLKKNNLQGRLKKYDFEELVCVSGWSDIFTSPELKNSIEKQKEYIYGMLDEIFTDKT